jgi:type I restriction enzyme M protein
VPPRSISNKQGSAAPLGLEATLWAAADKLRGNLDAAEYKHVVLGLIFLKYISDAFAEKYDALLADAANGADPEDRDEYAADNVFWVPVEARWPALQAKAKTAEIGTLLDDAMHAVELVNPRLKGVLPKEYARPSLDKRRLGELVDLISGVGVGDAESRAKDLLGRVYEYFLGQFASAEGKNGGEFYTPRSVVQLLVQMLAPYEGRIYDPCCGSGGMFVQSEKFVQAHGGRVGAISVYGQELNSTTWRLALMNLAIRGIDSNLGPKPADTLHEDLHRDLRADYVIANPPFNISDWGQPLLQKDVRWEYGVPPASNANFAWVQHFVHHLAPRGVAGFVLANGSMSTQQAGEGEIRKALVEADLVDCIIALPVQLFYSTAIPVCLWFLARDKRDPRYRDRRGETLFIDARQLGTMVSRVHRELTEADVARVTGAYHAWRGDTGAGTYADEAGFCRGARADHIRDHEFVLSPGRYVGTPAPDPRAADARDSIPALLERLRMEQDEGRRIDALINDALAGVISDA